MQPHPVTRPRDFLACLAFLAGLLLVVSMSADVAAEPVTTVINNGDPSNRLDIAILGDGFTASEHAQYVAAVDTLIGSAIAIPPYDEYGPYINVHRVDVTSAESGADHPERDPPVYVDTALDATYNCANIQRLICVNVSEAINIAANSLAADERDILVVLVNDPEYGGSGGWIAVASTHALNVDLVLHETGHSFGLLADEYGGSGPSCNSSSEPSEPNATKETLRAQIKWNAWIDALTPIPTTGYADALPGLYEGARYCTTGLYRPTYNSMMRSLGRPFEQINSEQLVKRIYNWVSPIDTVTPTALQINLGASDTQAFGVTPLAPNLHTLDMEWRLDGTQVAVGAEYLLDASLLSSGAHTLESVVSDGTPLVRSDPINALTETRAWAIQVPEPSISLQLAVGCFGLALMHRHRGRSRRPERKDLPEPAQEHRPHGRARNASETSGD